MTKALMGVAFAFGLLLSAQSATAHHSFAAACDANRPGP